MVCLHLVRGDAEDDPASGYGHHQHDEGHANDDARPHGVDHHRYQGDDHDEGGGDHEGYVGVCPLAQRFDVALVLLAVELQLDLGLSGQELVFRLARREGGGEAEQQVLYTLRPRRLRHHFAGVGVVVVQALRHQVDAAKEAGGAVVQPGCPFEEPVTRYARRRRRPTCG